MLSVRFRGAHCATIILILKISVRHKSLLHAGARKSSMHQKAEPQRLPSHLQRPDTPRFAHTPAISTKEPSSVTSAIFPRRTSAQQLCKPKSRTTSQRRGKREARRQSTQTQRLSAPTNSASHKRWMTWAEKRVCVGKGRESRGPNTQSTPINTSKHH